MSILSESTNPPNPFKGLRPYKQEDRDRLFGRDRDLILMKDRIFSARTTLLFAGSGVGKTSFLNAKVIPELEKQCVVIWHNRWTGADEQEVEDFSDDHGIRLWPPRAMFRDLARAFKSHPEDEGSPRSRPSTQSGEDLLEAQVRQTICENLRPGERPPRQLSESLSCFRKSSATKAYDAQLRDRCILILDQFEEVFQYHAYEDYFREFVRDLCEIINSDDYQVRVVFSMREEFLGELSIFDNKIPDLFINYYRLRYPDKDEAQDIIRRTCQLSGINPYEANLAALVEDLSKIEKGSGSFAERSTYHEGAGTRVIKRNFVAPPYLQIACDRLWVAQYAGNGEQTGPEEPVLSVTGTTNFKPFLIDYQAGSDAVDREPGGDAQKALRAFCEEKLSAPHLNRTQQDIVARAFGFLVTKQGAKMAYELRSLADHMEERVRPLKIALEKLSQDDAKILRESRGPDRSYWFELYHDMYATIVDEWKVRYLKLRKRRNLIKGASFMLSVVPLIIVLIYALFHWIVNPYLYVRDLNAFQKNINGPYLEQQVNYSKAVAAYFSLRNTAGYEGFANSRWAQILERKAQWCETANDPRSAFLSLVKAATMESDTETRNQYLQDAEFILGTDNTNLVATFGYDCASATMSPDGTQILTQNLSGQVRLWNANNRMPLGPPFCEACTQSGRPTESEAASNSAPVARKPLFSADGKTILTSALVSPSSSQDNSGSAAFLRLQLWRTADQELLRTIDFKPQRPPPHVGRSDEQRNDATSQAAASPQPAANAPPSIRAFAQVGNGFWVAGTRGQQIYVWDAEGHGRDLAPVNSPSVILNFSKNGHYLLQASQYAPERIWRVSESDITLYELPHLAKSIFAVFDPVGEKLLVGGTDHTVQLINLDSGNVVRELPPLASPVFGLGFSPSGEEFFTRVVAHSGDQTFDQIQVWKTATGAAISPELNLPRTNVWPTLGEYGKYLLRPLQLERGIIEKWDTQTGKLDGLMKRTFRTLQFTPDGNNVVLVSDRIAALWKIESSDFNARFYEGRFYEDNSHVGSISANGKRLLTIDAGNKVRFWNLDDGSALGSIDSAEVSFGELNTDGNYAATADYDKAILLWQVGRDEPLLRLPFEASVISFSHDNKVLAAAAGSKVVAWSIPGGSSINLSGEHSGVVNTLAANGQWLISGSDDRTARVWNLSNGQSQELKHGTKVNSVAISSDSKWVMTGDEKGTLRLWDPVTAQQIGGPVDFDGTIMDVTFSSDNRMAAVLTTEWMYLSTVDDKGLHYFRGSLIADEIQPRLSVGENGVFRFVYQAGRDRVEVQDLDPRAELKVLTAGPNKCLDEWEQRLGLRVGELGQIETRWPAEATQSASTKEEKKLNR
jgi:WD40 repeat protein